MITQRKQHRYITLVENVSTNLDNITKTYLYITVAHKTVDEMATQYGFNQEQKDYLTELLTDENNSMWSSVLYGISTADGEIVSVALSQIGNVGGEPLIGLGMALAVVWNGSYRSARMNAAISTQALFLSTPDVFMALSGSKTVSNGWITPPSLLRE